MKKNMYQWIWNPFSRVEKCEAGYYKAAGMTQCDLCLGNSVSEVEGADKCVPCTGGREATPDKTMCCE